MVTSLAMACCTLLSVPAVPPLAVGPLFFFAVRGGGTLKAVGIFPRRDDEAQRRTKPDAS